MLTAFAAPPLRRRRLPLLRRLASCADLVFSMFTVCPHVNRHYLSPDLQACWDCERVRTICNESGPGFWHKGVL